MKHILLILPLISCSDLTLSYAVGDLVTVTLSIIYEFLLFCHNESCIVLNCLKPLVLSNVDQGGSLSASFQDYNCSLKNPALMGKIMWSSEL